MKGHNKDENKEGEKLEEELKRKLMSVKNIVPDGKNEQIIRNLCHILLNEAMQMKNEHSMISRAEKTQSECYEILNALERNKIIASEAENYMPFYKYDLPLLVKNAVCASDILLPHGITVKSRAYSPFFAVCSEKLITRAVCEEALYFCRNYESGTAEFSAVKKTSCSLLSAKFKSDNQLEIKKDEKMFSVLRKTAQIHGGAFLIRSEGNSISFNLSIKNADCDTAVYRRAPSYIDMLSDRTSSIYIILGSSRS